MSSYRVLEPSCWCKMKTFRFLSSNLITHSSGRIHQASVAVLHPPYRNLLHITSTHLPAISVCESVSIPAVSIQLLLQIYGYWQLLSLAMSSSRWGWVPWGFRRVVCRKLWPAQRWCCPGLPSASELQGCRNHCCAFKGQELSFINTSLSVMVEAQMVRLKNKPGNTLK